MGHTKKSDVRTPCLPTPVRVDGANDDGAQQKHSDKHPKRRFVRLRFRLVRGACLRTGVLDRLHCGRCGGGVLLACLLHEVRLAPLLVADFGACFELFHPSVGQLRRELLA